MSSKNETTIRDVDGDELIVTWGWSGGIHGIVMVRTQAAHGEVVLSLSDIAKLREALDRAESAYRARFGEQFTGIDGCSCEPSTRSRVFKTPACEGSDNAEEWLINEVYEVCPSILGAWQVIPPTHAEQSNKPPLAPACVPPGQIGGRIRSLRRAAGLTLEDTAKAMGTSIPYASSVERGNIIPTPDRVEELAKLFGIDAATLWPNDASPQNPTDNRE